jgi:hypothetical protein
MTEKVSDEVIVGLIQAANQEPEGSGAWIVASISQECLDLRRENERLMNGLAHLAECHAATAEHEGHLKRTSRSSRKRFKDICLNAADLLLRKGMHRNVDADEAISRCEEAAEDLDKLL